MPDLPGDNHVHTEWSWDAVEGAMEATCARAEQLRLPSVAFTEHADLTPWVVRPGDAMPDVLARWLRPHGRVAPRPLDVEGYLACLQGCRERYPGLRVLSEAQARGGAGGIEPGRRARATRPRVSSLLRECAHAPRVGARPRIRPARPVDGVRRGDEGAWARAGCCPTRCGRSWPPSSAAAGPAPSP